MYEKKGPDKIPATPRALGVNAGTRLDACGREIGHSLLIPTTDPSNCQGGNYTEGERREEKFRFKPS